MMVDLSRCKITHPDGEVEKGRFLFYKGTAAVWVENKKEGRADRVLYTTSASFDKAPKARMAHILHLPDDAGTWQIFQQSGGCGCGSKLKAYDIHQLLDPDFTTTAQ